MKFIIAFFGSFIYNFILFQKAKELCDENNTEFDYIKYCKLNWDNWLLTTLLAPVLVVYLNDIVALLNHKLSLDLITHEIYYLGAGPFTELVIFGVSKLLGWKKTWVTPVHKP
jgi:hypothetical protein